MKNSTGLAIKENLLTVITSCTKLLYRMNDLERVIDGLRNELDNLPDPYHLQVSPPGKFQCLLVFLI